MALVIRTHDDRSQPARFNAPQILVRPQCQRCTGVAHGIFDGGEKAINKYSLSVAAAVLGLIVPLNMAIADEDSGSLPALTAQWRQWADLIPTTQNPQEDATGQYCMVGQRGPVWFLAGVFLGGIANRSCTVPEGKALFFPVINQDAFDAPNVCEDGPEIASVKDLRAAAKAPIDSITDLSVEVDGKDVKDPLQRIKSIVYELALPEENVFEAICGKDGLPAGIYSPAVDDGYYVLLKPTKPGVHVIHFKGNSGFEDVTYTLMVQPVLLK